MVGDVSDPGVAQEAVAAALDAFGRVDLLVNNAGSSGRPGETWGCDPEEWWRTVTVNLRGPMLMTAAVVPHMLAAGGGRIVNINSLVGTRPAAGHSAYSVSKAGLARLTDVLAAELADTPVRVFDLSPGLVHTAMTDALHEVFADVPEEEWTPMSKVVTALLAVASGRYDDLAGRFLHAEDDLDELLGAVRRTGTGRQLRLTGAWAEDPVIT